MSIECMNCYDTVEQLSDSCKEQMHQIREEIHLKSQSICKNLSRLEKSRRIRKRARTIPHANS